MKPSDRTSHSCGPLLTSDSLIRQLIERERACEREQELLDMFNAAAEDVSEEDLKERESLLGGLACRPLD